MLPSQANAVAVRCVSSTPALRIILCSRPLEASHVVREVPVPPVTHSALSDEREGILSRNAWESQEGWFVRSRFLQVHIQTKHIRPQAILCFPPDRSPLSH